MNERPYFITKMDDKERRTLLVRIPEDYNYFEWGPITENQEQILEDCGVFDLGGIPDALGITEEATDVESDRGRDLPAVDDAGDSERPH